MTTDSPDDRISPEPPRKMRRYSPNVHRYRQRLRLDLTPVERTLWEHLRNRQLDGVKFRRQHPIDSFVLDFYAPELRLAIELDGNVHELSDRKAADKHRQERLEKAGITVIRFTNWDIAIGLEDVLTRISAAIARQRKIP
jgi:very-short-patch-repair endonuclease